MFLSGGVEFSTQNLLQKGRPFILRRVTGQVGICPETTLCGHPKQGIQGTWSQALATWVEVGFLGSLSAPEISTLRMFNFLGPDFWRVIEISVVR